VVGQASQALDFELVESDVSAVEIDRQDLGRVGHEIRQYVAAARGDSRHSIARPEPQRLHVDDRVLPDLRIDQIAERQREKALLNAAARERPATVDGRAQHAMGFPADGFTQGAHVVGLS
jgi:hypothetical protein